ncbi:inositol monophosphatase family protein [Aspergillus affinis]|uniref:inositol monophosphatase family protein n=1 Tax=Aspergillus affinis TaxID=1070780 RepID=UPI0022FE01E3|nr:uncharacterized protein KD926_004250 [Aspergillus affinis]KAI9035233.1 hypothetical protein KD926_004250 [Aspergillus affinis]
MDPYTHELHIATLAVHCASIITKIMQAVCDKGSRDKEDASPVTVADFAAQAILISALRHHFPDDQFIGEESAAVLRKDPELVERVWALVTALKQSGMRHGGGDGRKNVDGVDDDEVAEEIQASIPVTRDEMLRVIDLGGNGEGAGDAAGRRTWILDPIDGTATFIRGQQFAVSVALVVDGEQRVGVVGYPNLKDGGAVVHEDAIDDGGYGLLVSAVKGQGASKRVMLRSGLQPAEKLVQMSANKLVFVESLASPYVSLERQSTVRDRLQATAPITDLWSMQVKYGALIIGACNAMVRIPKHKDYRPWAWDHAGGMLVYEESGGRITDLHGRPFQYRGRKLMANVGVVAALPEVHAHVLKVARQVSEDDQVYE